MESNKATRPNKQYMKNIMDIGNLCSITYHTRSAKIHYTLSGRSVVKTNETSLPNSVMRKTEALA